MKLKNVLFKGARMVGYSAVSFLSLFLLPNWVTSQTLDVQVGTGTSTTSAVPLSSCYGYTYSQQIYKAADLQAAGLTVGATISTLRFFYVSGTTNNSTDWTVYIGNTAKTEFASNTDWESSASLQSCFSGIVSYPAAGNWLEINLSAPFHWDGTSNLVVGIDENQSGYNCSINWRYSSLGNNSSIYYRNDSTNPDPNTPPSATGRNNYIPNAQFIATLDPPCSGAPAIPQIAVTPNDTLCAGTPFTMSKQTGYAFSGISYQWQKFSSGAWADIVNQTGPTMLNTGISVNTEYRLNVTCANSNQTATSIPILMVINALPVVAVSASTTSICNGDVAAITASGASTYSWSPATGLNNTNTASVFASPTATTTYTVSGTDANGCVGINTTKVIPNTEAKVNLAITPGTHCEPGTVITATLSNAPANSNGANWEYRFLKADGMTVAQNWNTSNVYDFIPATDSVYTYYYQMRNISCPSEYIDSVKYDITIGFGAQYTKVDYDCNNLGGKVLLTDLFGQQNQTPIYNTALNASSDMSVLDFQGAAAIAGGRAVITPSQTGTSGGLFVNVPNFQPGYNNSFKANFLLTMDQPINTYGTGGADGLTYSFGNDVNYGANLPNGSGSKLRLVFDAANNSPNVTGIYLIYGQTNTTAPNPTASTTLAFSTNTSLWKLKSDVPVSMNIDTRGRVTVTVGGTTVFSNIQLPASYLTENVTTWKHFFSAGTGGDALRQAVSNFELIANSIYVGVANSSQAQPSSWGQSSTISGLAPGVYKVWISKNQDTLCAKNIATIEILNANPQVDLGNDTTICAGQSLTLDAGNPGSSYTWSNSNAVTQTLTVSNAGNYVAYVTGTNGCVGISSINVAVQQAPSAGGIFMQGTYPNMNFTVLNAQNTQMYNWNFGDGSTLNNGPASVNHTYQTPGTYSVTATLTNACSNTDVVQSFEVVNTASLTENTLSGLTIFPVPATDKLTVQMPESVQYSMTVFAATGALVQAKNFYTGSTVLNVQSWEKGIYFLQIEQDNQMKTVKVSVQ